MSLHEDGIVAGCERSRDSGVEVSSHVMFQELSVKA